MKRKVFITTQTRVVKSKGNSKMLSQRPSGVISAELGCHKNPMHSPVDIHIYL